MKPPVMQLPKPHGWRSRIDSHDRFSHDSIAGLGYDWSRVANPGAEPQFPFAVYWPETTEDVVRVVREAAEAGDRLLVRGNAHSSNRLSTGEHARVVVTTRLTGLVDLDRSAGVVTVRAGTVTADLDDYLGTRGLGLPVMGSHNHITVGGFASVGGVGMTCHHHGLFADNVEGIEYVDWDGEVHSVSRAADPVELQRLLCGTGQHGIITELTLRVVEIDKDGTLLELHQEAFRDFDGWLAALDPLMLDSPDVMLRGLWTDFQRPGGLRLRRGTINRYEIVPTDTARRLRTTLAWGLLHGVGYFSGRVPGPVDLALRQVAIAGSIRPPRYAPYRHAEHLLDQVIDFSVGDASRWLISWAPVRTWLQLAREQTALLVDERDRERNLTFISLDIRPIRSGYLAQESGEDRFVEILYFVGLNPDRMTPEVEGNLIRRLDEACASHDAFRYMHTLTVSDQALRRRVDPNTYWATRAETARPASEVM
jgi:FAD/FMN-containing dehydrogenase